jgi:hypothetical protein
VVDDRLKRFSPRNVAPEAWAVVGPLARDAVSRADPADRDHATELMSATVQLLHWAYGQGVDLRPEVVFAQETLDRFISDGCAHLTPGTQTNRRRLLRKVGAAVLGPPEYPERPLRLPKSAPVVPYTVQEEATLAGWMRGLSTERVRRGAVALLGLGLGAGLRSREIDMAQVSWVEESAKGLTVVVPETPGRRVPVLVRWEWAIRQAVEHAHSGQLFLPEQQTARRKRVSVFTENLPKHHAPKLSVQRLRITWIVRHLDGRVPPNVLAAAAGVTGEQLFQYVASMAPADPDEADRLLRGDRR